MKRLWMAAACAVLVLMAAAPCARAIDAFATWWNMNDPGDDGFGGGLRFPVPLTPVVGVDVRASYVAFSGNDIGVFPVEATGTVPVGLLYAGIGIGYYMFTGNGLDIDNSFGWYPLVGAGFSLGPVGVFGEFKWNLLKADFKNTSGQADFDGAGFNLGVKLGN